MVNVVFCAHGKLACAMLGSIRMVYGDANVGAVASVPRENTSDTVERLKRLISIHTNDEWLVAVDLQCGNPWNAVTMLVIHNLATRVINGSPLPLTLELVNNQSNTNVGKLYKYLTTITQQIRVVWKHLEAAEEGF